jgi:hypothetical protein
MRAGIAAGDAGNNSQAKSIAHSSNRASSGLYLPAHSSMIVKVRMNKTLCTFGVEWR